ncbi:bifunctional adenosylcobinamide kinase/adenosylcobinamide-phosphate guanylyltransferase [Cyanobacterium aponinum AL20118]|uniref:Adenosylcobinamide kinase n=2 Tax=Cyanobacterium aponinum TaxID=379064 RepID=A0A844H012_9CHRO|nr:bifunctional adenosylcobinamide kinase/adenosylcobinamide-phosphate guanylyltransferase [Cyanobacterium aponinum]MBD2393906.1 bifunctional adenosylcobinamide kinase/adenosylcobinamide-phosphate guanylyltransferase [Cyanobacterium aponinum FACHB-4101]MTF39556.1 bifunctional adenosylcobinamide kinase/adenosylcobinamide-phosphate guanylyltransferase [Cyanobacterium aponinum 0216]WPF89036.1 bifunctional adenosylcobinamide kinase/adenosylcobinamide-phosphate guanylyltransferase [Cyanobacterium apo
MSITLVTGAANSGKSEWAEYLASQCQKPVIYIATGLKNDHDIEWQKKIEQHQIRRPKNWQTLEIPYNLVDAIALNFSDNCILVDSLGTWVANYLDKNNDDWQKEINHLLETCREYKGEIIFVGEETGWGVVPAYELGRLFRSRLGNLIRLVGGIANSVYLMVGGYAVDVAKLGINLTSVQDKIIGSQQDKKFPS